MRKSPSESTRVALATFFQETNSFSPLKTGQDALRHGGMLDPKTVEEKFRGTETEIGGALDVLEGAGAEAQFLPSLWLLPAGPLTAEALRMFSERFEDACSRLAADAGAFLTSVHGCLASEDEPDATGWFLERLRSQAGRTAVHGADFSPRVPPDGGATYASPRPYSSDSKPIVAAADFHANVTPRLLGNVDLLVGYRTYPHSDLRETGRRAARALERLMHGSARPHPVVCRLPLIVPTETSQHDASPMREVWQGLARIEAKTGWPASCFCPHPWLDAPDAHVVLLAYAETAMREKARRAVTRLAEEFWAPRDQLYRPMPDLPAAWKELEACAERPSILVDSGDVVLAGAPGDSTVILHFLSRNDTHLKCLLHVTDPDALQQLKVGEAGAIVHLHVGGGIARGFYDPVRITARLRSISDVPYVASGAYLGGVKVNAGRRAVLEWGNHCLIVSERPDPAHDPAFFRSLAVEPERYDVIVVKSHNTFRPAYRGITESVFRAATPGTTSPDLRSLPYSCGRQDLYPLANPSFAARIGTE